MSIDSKTLIGLALIGGLYVYMTKTGQAVPVGSSSGGVMRPATMPQSAGTGLNQVEAGAITGFLNSILNSTRNNSANGNPYVSETGNGVVNGGGYAEFGRIAQENVWAGVDPNIWTSGSNQTIDSYNFGEMAYA